MSRWTDEELRELVTLWPTHSVSQLVERLHRPRWAIRSKAKRLRLDGLRPHNPSEDVEADNPPKRRRLKAGHTAAGAECQHTGEQNGAGRDRGDGREMALAAIMLLGFAGVGFGQLLRVSLACLTW